MAASEISFSDKSPRAQANAQHQRPLFGAWQELEQPAVRSLRRGQRDGGVVLSRVVSFSAGAPAGGFLAPV